MKRHGILLPLMIVAVLLSGVFLLVGCGGTAVQAQEADNGIVSRGDTPTIPAGIYIGDVDVGGMTGSQAADAVSEYVDSISEQTIILTANGKILKPTLAELGFREDIDSAIEEALNYGKSGNLLERYKKQKDLEQEDIVYPLVLTADEELVGTYLEEHYDDLTQEAVDFGLIREDGEFIILEGEAGQGIDVDECAGLIATAFIAGWEENTTVSLPVEVIEPKGSGEELALVQDVLGKYSTDYSSSSSARKTNIQTGAACIDGSLIYPGETFSVESAVTPFDEEHGYEQAPSYESGKTVDTYGGGICQVSTTLYNAVIRAELEIVERHGHSMIVSYVDPSADAAIAEGTKDFQFTNNTDAPIYISAYTDGATISFTIYGHETRPSNRSVSFESETLSTEEPTVEYRASTSEPFGTITLVQNSHTGMTAQLWKIVTVDGEEESREVFNSTVYQMSPTIYEVGVSSDSEAKTSAMYDAIGTQSLDKIYETIANYSSSSSSSSSGSSSEASSGSSESSESSSDDTGDSYTEESGSEEESEDESYVEDVSGGDYEDENEG